jgi:septal ring factor EnvC (AmiA/AmiB activator)
MSRPGVPDVDGDPNSRAEANSRYLKELREDLESLRDGMERSFHNVEEHLEEQHGEIQRLEQKIRRIELFIGEFGAAKEDERR